MAELTVKLKKRELQTVSVGKKDMTIGRDSDCDVFIDNVGVSRIHTHVIYHEGRFWVQDSGSSNGTFLNGKQVQQAALKDGDEIQIGKYKIIFSMAGGMPAHLLADSKQTAEEDAAKKRGMAGTVQFSPEDIQTLIETADQPASI